MTLAILAWLAAAYVTTSALEYFPHRWTMHSRALAWRLGSLRLAEEFEAHATLHHGRYFGSGRFTGCTEPAARYVSIDTGALYMLANLWWVWVPVLLFSLTGGIVFAAFFALHGITWSAMHREMHYPSGGWLSRTAAYRFIRAYHLTHHERQGTNFNVLCPLMDFIFGTYAGAAR